MPSFAAQTPGTISDFIIPVTPEMAQELWATAMSREDGESTLAVYYNVQNRDNGKVKRGSSLVRLVLDDDAQMGYCWLSEYHPRKDGLADTVVKTDQTIMGY